jgi:hypothetical protein
VHGPESGPQLQAERGRKREGGLSVTWSSAAVWYRRGSGPVVARGWCVAARQWRAAGSARRGRRGWQVGRDATGGLVVSDWVWRGAARWGGRCGADRWGRQHSAPDSVFKPNQIYFKRIQICSKFWLIKQVSSLVQKIPNKIWIDFVIVWIQIQKEIWTKIQRATMSWNSLENLETLDLDEIWPASSWLHIIARKNQFPSKEDQNFEFRSKREFRLISW